MKVVLAAAMWQNPHVLILDEPTNYLDREGLRVLVLAISDHKGGVLIISHNKEFRDGIATEKCCKMMEKDFLLDMSQHQITETGYPELSGIQCQLQAAAAEEPNDTGAAVYYVARKTRGAAGAESEWDEHDEFHDDDDTWYRIREMFEAKLLAELSGKMAGKVELDPAIVVAQSAVTELVADQDRSVAPAARDGTAPEDSVEVKDASSKLERLQRVQCVVAEQVKVRTKWFQLLQPQREMLNQVMSSLEEGLWRKFATRRGP